MKILFFFTYNEGLLSSFYQELATKLAHDNFEIVNFQLKGSRSHTTKDNVTIIQEKKGSNFKKFKSVYKVIKTCKPDIIISNFSYDYAALLFGRLLGVKKNVLWFHTMLDREKLTWHNTLLKTLFLKLANTIIANSYVMKKELNSFYRVAEDKMIVLPFWTNIGGFETASELAFKEFDSDSYKIGCPGRLISGKNQKIVIEAISELKKEGSKLNPKLYIAGGGPFKKELEMLVSKLKLEDSVFFLGLLDASEMKRFYDEMDVIVLPSKLEAFGLVLIETLSLGVPVLVSEAFGALTFMDENHDYRKMFTFNPNSVVDLKNRILELTESDFVKNKPDFFEKTYKETFDKESIYMSFKTLIIDTP